MSRVLGELKLVWGLNRLVRIWPGLCLKKLGNHWPDVGEFHPLSLVFLPSANSEQKPILVVTTR